MPVKGKRKAQTEFIPYMRLKLRDLTRLKSAFIYQPQLSENKNDLNGQGV